MSSTEALTHEDCAQGHGAGTVRMRSTDPRETLLIAFR
jgi:hypothetical protein